MEQFDFTILRELRKRAGLSIGEVSAESGVSAAVISLEDEIRSELAGSVRSTGSRASSASRRRSC